MSAFSDLTRKSFSASDKKRDAGLTTPDGVVRFDDIVYGADEAWNLLDVYRPKGCDGKKLPVIVSVHGGGWVYGDKDVYQYYCMSLAERGFAVVNFTYRLAPEYKFPASVEDTDNVFRWIYENTDTYGLDTENVFAVGDSAGAHLLGLYADLITNERYAKSLKEYFTKQYSVIQTKSDRDSRNIDLSDIKTIFTPQDKIKLKAVALNCGKYGLVKADESNPDTEDILNDFLVNGGDEEELKLVNVLEHITDKFPSVYIMTCYGDFLKNEAGRLTKRLEDVGVPFEYHFYGSKDNPLGHVFHCNIRLEEGQSCNDDECVFFRKFID